MIRSCRILALAFIACAAAPASADVYGFVDEHGVAHFSDVALDARYQLFMKDKPRPEQTASPETVPVTVHTPPASQSRKHYVDMIARVAHEQKVDAALLHAVVMVESAYNPRAVSPKGATGLMQLMPDTGKRYGVTNLLDPLQNLRGGARYLRDLLTMFNNNLGLVLAAYNAGEGAVIRFGNAIPPYRETREYVPRVMQHYQRYRAL
jgi:soluble lytic murein transglycosylase-like protein